MPGTKFSRWWRPGARAGVVCALLLGAAPLAAQVPARPAAPPAAEEGIFRYDPASHPHADLPLITLEGRTVVGFFSGNVVWSYVVRGVTVRLLADRLVWVVDLPERDAVPAAGAGREDRPRAARGREGSAAGGISSRLGEIQSFTIVAENCRVEIPARNTYLEAETFYYEHRTERGIARNARLLSTFETAAGLLTMIDSANFRPGFAPARSGDENLFLRSPLSVHADVLRFTGHEVFDGEGVEVSVCDFAVPHFALRASTVRLEPAGDGAAGAETVRRESPDGQGDGDGEGEARHFIIDPEDAWLEISRRRVLPFPIGKWDTRWQTSLPIREIDVGRSSKFGTFGAVDWNLNYFLSLLPPSRFLPLEVVGKTRLGFETDFLEKRGTGIGPHAEYGMKPRGWDPWQLQLREWNYYGEAQYFRIHDKGDEDRSTRLPVPERDRFWGHVWHRQSVPHVGLFDLEYSKLSDPAFLGEYFEHEAKEEKAQEDLIYFRRNLLDNLAVTALYQTRSNDFLSQTERLPEGKALLFQQPVFETGLYTDLGLQAAYLHRLEDDALGVSPRGFARFDALNEWAYPVSWFAPWVQLRPFALLRFTHYGETLLDDTRSEDRASFGAGVALSQQLSRVYRFEADSLAQRVLGISNLKHVIVPKLTYLNLFANDLEASETVPIDETDTVDIRETFSISVRNSLFTRRPLGEKATHVAPLVGRRKTSLETVPFETRRLLDSEVSFVLFPHAHRDNDGDRSSLLVFDNTVDVLPGLGLRAWIELDPNRSFRGERVDASVKYEVIPKKLSVSLGDRYTRQLSNVGYLASYWVLSDKWIADIYYARDFERERDVEYSITLSRLFHSFAFSIEYSEDVGEDRNRGVHFSFMPLQMLQPGRRGRYR
ncbi:MAG TPA: hypothetical protein VMT52_17565 [Planctomycetota bacterium]|nr:hypothetical protein [Planctomycetota bacterium]